MFELYQSQRAMRAMRKAAMQRGVVAVLDVGTSKIACLVLRFDGVDHLAVPGAVDWKVAGVASTVTAIGSVRALAVEPIV